MVMLLKSDLCSPGPGVGPCPILVHQKSSMITANNSTDSKTVFLVDDNSSTGNLYSNRLEQAGFRTAAAAGAEEALQALPTLSADLIILDLMLPKRRGLELLQAIRTDRRHKDTPVLVVSNAY